MIKSLHHAGLSVRDLDRSIAFYCSLGMQVMQQETFEGGSMDRITGLRSTCGRSAMLKAGDRHLELFEFRSPAPKSEDPVRPVCDHGITHVCIEVADVQHEYRRLAALGVSFHSEPQRFGSMWAVYGRDPDGNVVELLSSPAS